MIDAEELQQELTERGIPAMVVLEAGAQMMVSADPAGAEAMAAMFGGGAGVPTLGFEVGATDAGA